MNGIDDGMTEGVNVFLVRKRTLQSAAVNHQGELSHCEPVKPAWQSSTRSAVGHSRSGLLRRYASRSDGYGGVSLEF